MIPVCIDLETRPAFVPADELLALATASKANPKRTPATRAEWASDPANQAKAWSRGALGMATARIICAAVIIDGEPIQCWASWDDEGSIVRQLDRVIDALDGRPLWIGHNISAFDLPLIRLAAMRHGLPRLRDAVPTYRYDRERIHDNMTRAIEPAGSFSGVSADALARCLGLSGKGEIGSIDFGAMYARALDGEVADVMAAIRLRCETDVEIEWATFEKMTAMG